MREPDTVDKSAVRFEQETNNAKIWLNLPAWSTPIKGMRFYRVAAMEALAHGGRRTLMGKFRDGMPVTCVRR